MISKPHRNNSDFQLRHFMAGSCHTPDGAWMLMYGQRIDVENKIAHTKAQKLRRDAASQHAREMLTTQPDATAYERAEWKADLMEAEAAEPIAALNLEAAEAELATIKSIMADLEPLRKYGDLPLLEANEAAQRDEWLGELKRRAENFILTQGTIPFDHFETMRQHPDFEAKILPHLRAVAANPSIEFCVPVRQEQILGPDIAKLLCVSPLRQ